MLSNKQLNDVCLAYSKDSSSCRYLSIHNGAYHCCKLHLGTKKMLDEKVESIHKFHKSRGEDPKDSLLPIADNCKGYVYGLNYVQQGYDC